MDALRFGRQFRALRIRVRKRQSDVSADSGLSRSLIAAIDRGQLDGVTIGALRKASAALDADIDLWLRWRGERLDRLVDEDHAAIVESVVRRLRALGWVVEVEVSFSIWGERGSIDVFAFHREHGALLVVEIKSVVPDSQATLHGLDRKTRLAREIVGDRGWRIGHVSKLLVIRDTSTSRRRVARLRATYDIAFPIRGRHVSAWLRRADRPIAGLLFLPDGSQISTRPRAQGRERVNRPRRPPQRPNPAPDDSSGSIRADDRGDSPANGWIRSSWLSSGGNDDHRNGPKRPPAGDCSGRKPCAMVRVRLAPRAPCVRAPVDRNRQSLEGVSHSTRPARQPDDPDPTGAGRR